MKKIIALIASLAMVVTASIPVFAASVPADANIVANITITDQNKQQSSTGRERYEFRLDLSGLGTLAEDGTRISLFELQVLGDNINKQGSAVKSASIGSIGTYGDIAGGFTAIMTASSVPSMFYNATGTADGAVIFDFWGNPGQTLTYSIKIGYSQCYYDEDDEDVYLVSGDKRADTTVNGTVKVPGGEEPATLGLTADLIGHYDDRGYIWNANVTKGENEISSFGVEFSAGGDTKTGSIANISALTNKYTGAEFTFQVGLKTTKTLDSATFSIADGGDPITADAPVSK